MACRGTRDLGMGCDVAGKQKHVAAIGGWQTTGRWQSQVALAKPPGAGKAIGQWQAIRRWQSQRRMAKSCDFRRVYKGQRRLQKIQVVLQGHYFTLGSEEANPLIAQQFRLFV